VIQETPFGSNSTVSVVIPWGKLDGDVERCLRSVKAQTRQPDQVYVIVNGQILNFNYSKLESDYCSEIFTFIEVPGCENANIARNIGVSLSRSDYVAFLDSDDWWEPNHLAHSIAQLDASNSDLIYSGMLVHGPDEEVTELAASNFQQHRNMETYLLNYLPAQSSSFVARRPPLLKCLWDVSLKRHQDYEFLARFSRNFNVMHSADVSVHVDWTLVRRSKSHEDCFRVLEMWRPMIERHLHDRHFLTLFRSAVRSSDRTWVRKSFFGFKLYLRSILRSYTVDQEERDR
jgi:glycosyltransferase involved in cell wall biosynthesis